MNEKWLGARMTAPRAGNLLGGDAARAQERVCVQRGDQARELIRPSWVRACARARGTGRSTPSAAGRRRPVRASVPRSLI